MADFFDIDQLIEEDQNGYGDDVDDWPDEEYIPEELLTDANGEIPPNFVAAQSLFTLGCLVYPHPVVFPSRVYPSCVYRRYSSNN